MPPDTSLTPAQRWAVRHPGFTVQGRVLPAWLRLMWTLATPLAALGVSPDLVTLSGGGLAVAATRSRPGRATALLVASAACDGLDGAVAVLRDTSTAHGAALDHATDRVGDVCAATVLVRAGAPAALVAPAALLGLWQEGHRRRAARPLAVVTVHERPTRVVCAALGDTAAALTGRRWPAVVAALVWDLLAVIGAAQLRRAGRAHS